MKYFSKDKTLLRRASLIAIFSVVFCCALGQYRLYSAAQPINEIIRVASIPPEAEKGLLYIKNLYGNYRAEKGQNPENLPDLIQFAFAECITSGKSSGECNREIHILISKDNDSSVNQLYNKDTFSYYVFSKRPNGEIYGSPRMKGERDMLALTEIYVNNKFIGEKHFLSGFYVALWDDGKIEKIPADEAIRYSTDGKTRHLSFKGQAGLPFSLLSEFDDNTHGGVNSDGIPLLKPPSKDAVVDNYGPESLVQLSRRENFPDIYGVDRNSLWKIFAPSQSQFTLSEVQEGATKLGLSTDITKQTLNQLQRSGTSALLSLQDDGRIITLTAIDDDHVVVMDRGITYIASRYTLEKRYSGDALVPTKALTQNAAIVADDAVREVKLPSLDAEVPQQFTLRNTGDTPITLQLEYPLLGVTESKLSRDIIAPGETATLDLKVKWRSILQAPYQNVLISIQTNDPIVPRLQLAVLLVPPRAVDN